MEKRRKLRLSKTAQSDLEKIDFYSFEKWGEATAAAYMAGIETRMKALIENPMLGADRSDLRQGFRASIAGRHVIYYRLDEELIYVLTVLHHSQDHAAFLADLSEECVR